MARHMVDMEDWTFLVINVPLVSLSLVANVFYLCCLYSPPRGRTKLKQPLKTLLAFLIWTSIVFLLSIFCMYGMVALSRSQLELFVSWNLMLCHVHSSMMTSVWLSVYYCVQIVPLRGAFFLWVKKNIKLVVYTALFCQEVLIYLVGVAHCANLVVHHSSLCNATLAEGDPINLSSTSGFYVVMVNIVGCLVLMTVSNFSMFHYLRSHMRKVTQRNVFPQKRTSQLRVAIASVFQGVIYFTFCTFYFFCGFTFTFSPTFMIGVWLSLTCTTLYIFGTTVNMGVGQTLFRRKAVAIWRTIAMSTHQQSIKT